MRFRQPHRRRRRHWCAFRKMEEKFSLRRESGREREAFEKCKLRYCDREGADGSGGGGKSGHSGMYTY